ncbi:MAG TPA: sulfurtransferase [Bryobacteraceae bacterium]|nr:sulfurtransferase [Bryobacteraceae bacterium]
MISSALRVLACSVFVLPALCPGAVTCGDHGDRNSMLVSTAWVAAHASDPGVVLISVGPRAEYDKGHIAGAQFMDLADISAKGVPLSLELPPMSELEETFRAHGVSNDSRIILYSIAATPQSTTRVYLTLDAMGLGRNAALMDGGMPQWRSENRPVTTAIPAVKRGTATGCGREDIITNAEFVSANLRHRGVDVVDARLTGFYTGEQIPPGQRAGHIPGAASMPFNTLVDSNGKLKTPEQLSEMFNAAGIKSGDRVVSYCHIGQQATVVYFVARYLGYDARLYDGSWQDWSQRTELPAAAGPKP